MKSFNCLNCNRECIFDSHHKANKYCSFTCQQRYQTNKRIKQWLEEGKDWSLGIPAWIKAPYGYLSQTKGYTCEVCGISEYNGKSLVLECDHVDGNHKNNSPDNLRLICPNCHSQTSTYKNRNKGNGRTYRNK
jgi:HNH endonuclease